MGNLKGFKARRFGQRHTLVSWDSHVASYRVSVKDTLEIRKSMDKQVLSTRIEKRRRGDPGGPLASEKIHVTAKTRRDQAWDVRKRIKVVQKTADLLPAVIFRPVLPGGLARWTLIYLHGMSSSALHEYADRPHFFYDGTAAVKVIIPTAPSRELSCFDEWWVERKVNGVDGTQSRFNVVKFPAWYDYTTNQHGRKEDHIDWPSLHAMRLAIHGLIEREAQELNGRYDRIILGGKSQGCCTALDATLTFTRKLGGFVGTVGHLLGCTPVEPDGPQSRTPLHFFHEPSDDIFRWNWVKGCEQRLKDAKYRVHSHQTADPEGCGHFIGGIEGCWIREALRSIYSS